MTWVEAVGVVAMIANIWGNLLLVNLNARGWVVRLATNCLWMIHAFHTDGSWPLLLNHLAFFYINIAGWVKWRAAKQLELANRRLVPIDHDRGAA
jgi:hypothetical protein